MSYPLANGQRQLLFIWYENDFWYYIPHVAIGRR
jgi:hypothetical protein